MKHDNHDSSITKESVTYALGYIEAKLAEIARDFNEPEQEFREWVAILLLSQRQGISNRVSTLSGKTSRLYQAMGKMEMDEQPHRKTRGPYTPRKVKAKAQSGPSNRLGYKYNGTHWMQRPENKAKVIALAKKRAAARAKAA